MLGKILKEFQIFSDFKIWFFSFCIGCSHKNILKQIYYKRTFKVISILISTGLRSILLPTLSWNYDSVPPFFGSKFQKSISVIKCIYLFALPYL